MRQAIERTVGCNQGLVPAPGELPVIMAAGSIKGCELKTQGDKTRDKWAGEEDGEWRSEPAQGSGRRGQQC